MLLASSCGHWRSPEPREEFWGLQPPIESQMTSYIIEAVRTKCIIGEALKVRGPKYDKFSLKIVQKALKWPLQYANV